MKQWNKIVLYIGKFEGILWISSVWNGEEVTGLVPSKWELRIQKAAFFTASATGGCGNNVSSGKWMPVPCG